MPGYGSAKSVGNTHEGRTEVPLRAWLSSPASMLSGDFQALNCAIRFECNPFVGIHCGAGSLPCVLRPQTNISYCTERICGEQVRSSSASVAKKWLSSWSKFRMRLGPDISRPSPQSTSTALRPSNLSGRLTMWCSLSRPGI